MSENKLVTNPKQRDNQPTRPKALEVLASRLNIDPVKLLSVLKNTVFKNASEDELAALVLVSNTYGLDPILKEIYAFPAKGGGIQPIVSVDGWNKMLLRQPDFDGIKFDFTDDSDGHPYSCTATIFVKGRGHPVEVTEYFSECKRNTDPWNNMPRRMLRNRTLCQGARMAFGFSGVFHEEELPLPSVVQIDLDPRIKKLAAPVADADPDAPKPRTPQEELCSLIIEAGYSFSDFQAWAEVTGQILDATAWPDFDAVPAAIATRLMRAQAGLLKGLETAKAGGAA